LDSAERTPRLKPFRSLGAAFGSLKAAAPSDSSVPVQRGLRIEWLVQFAQVPSVMKESSDANPAQLLRRVSFDSGRAVESERTIMPFDVAGRGPTRLSPTL